MHSSVPAMRAEDDQWRTWWSSAPNGETKARARLSTGSPRRPTSSCAFQGGHNAGHTLVIDGTTYKLSLLPSGVVRPGKLSVIGNGVVLDPCALVEEIERLRGQGVT